MSAILAIDPGSEQSAWLVLANGDPWPLSGSDERWERVEQAAAEFREPQPMPVPAASAAEEEEAPWPF